MGRSRGYCGRKRNNPTSPPVESHVPYDEITHEIDNNFLSFKVGKNVGQFEQVAAPGTRQGDPTLCAPKDFEIPSVDEKGKKCNRKVNVIPNKLPPPKRPDEDMLFMRTTRQITTSDEVKNSLEIRFKMARNYTPLPVDEPLSQLLDLSAKDADDGKGKGGKKGGKGGGKGSGKDGGKGGKYKNKDC